MKTINEIYNFLSQSIIKYAPQDWKEAYFNIEIVPAFSSYSGFYVKTVGRMNMSVALFPVETGEYLWELHKLTTKGGNIKWNKARFTVKPDMNFDMEFIWDQSFQDEVDRKNRNALFYF